MLPFQMVVDSEMQRYRYETFWTKEPETVAWIKSFNPQGVFVDIGANIGIYSLYAASLFPEMTVIACEPVHANFNRLCENIKLNGFKNVIPLPVAVGWGRIRVVDLHIKSDGVGDSGSQIESPIDEHGQTYEATDVQKTICIPFGLIEAMTDAAPNYVKVDVDGEEYRIAEGFQDFQHLRIWTSIESILIEVNKEVNPVEDFSKLFGKCFEIDHSFDNNHSNERRGGNPENVIWRRK